jgi:hypothetical protein
MPYRQTTRCTTTCRYTNRKSPEKVRSASGSRLSRDGFFSLRLSANLSKTHFNERIGAGEWRGDPCQPIFSGDCFSRTGEIFWWQESGRCGELSARDLSPDGAGRDLYLRIIANALDLPHFANGHDVELAVFFSEPHWSRNAHAALAEGRQRNIFLALNWERNRAGLRFQHERNSKL